MSILAVLLLGGCVRHELVIEFDVAPGTKKDEAFWRASAGCLVERSKAAAPGVAVGNYADGYGLGDQVYILCMRSKGYTIIAARPVLVRRPWSS